MANKENENEIEISKLSEEELNDTVDCSSGLSSQGIVNPIPTPSGKTEYFFLEEGQPIPDKYKKMIVENAEFHLKSTPAKYRKKLQQNISAWRKEMGMK